MAYQVCRHLSLSEAIRYFQGEFDYWENNALENHLSQCKPCVFVLEEAFFDLEAAELVSIPSQVENYIDHRLDFEDFLDAVESAGQRKLVPN